LFVTQKIIFNIIGKTAAWVDRNIVDGFMNLLAGITALFSELIKGFQSGKLQQYAVYFFAGVIGFVLVFIYLWT
jgi:NADH-quinone oxidoreductase subunit L